jgi:nicotinamidase/pyrazinamidase
MAKRKGIFKKIILSIVGLIVLLILILIINLVIFEKKASLVSKGIPIETYNKINPALLVIDIQEATTGSMSNIQHYKNESSRFIEQANTVAELFSRNQLPVIYIRSEISNVLINLLNSSFARGGIGVRFDSRLNLVSSNEIIKSRNDAFYNTDLDEVLNKNEINELYIVGLDAAHCINITVEAAQNRNYKIKLVREAILSESLEMKDSMLVEFENRGVEVVNMDKLKFTTSTRIK